MPPEGKPYYYQGMEKALSLVQAVPKREWDEGEADSIAANSARAFNYALVQAKDAIIQELSSMTEEEA